MGGGGQWPAVLGLGWWPVAAMAEMAGEKAASTMSEAVAAMVVVAAGTNRNVLGGFFDQAHRHITVFTRRITSACRVLTTRAHTYSGGLRT